MVRILFIIPEFKFGGTVISTYNMISVLSSEKYQIDVLAMTHQGSVKDLYEANKINILEENIFLSSLTGKFQEEKTFLRKCFFLFNKIIRRFLLLLNKDYLGVVYKRVAKAYTNYDVVVACQEGVATEFASYITVSKKIAWFRSECKYWINEVDPSLSIAKKKAVKVYQKYNNIVCVSETTRRDMIDVLPELSSRVVAIHNIQDVTSIVNKSLEHFSDDRFNTDVFTIISIGRMSPQKRFAHIPEIAYKLKKSGCHFKWYIIGGGNTYNEYDNLLFNINQFDVKDCVLLLGEKLNPYPYIVKSNLLVNTSYIEACPRVVIEAKILQVPVICADFSSAYEFITDNHDGFIRSIESIDSPISSMILDNDLYIRIKNNCMAYTFSNDVLRKKVEDILC